MNYTKNLWLVNSSYPLAEEYQVETLVTSDSPSGIQLTQEAMTALKDLLDNIKGGALIKQVSGYRNYETQRELYDTSLRENGRTYTEKYVAKPGASEHQTGLAVDVGLAQAKAEEIAPDFPSEGVAGRFKQEAANFGFILRYPKGKEAITQIAYEPWHYRYVGLPHSQIMSVNRWTLEEYYEVLHQRTFLDWHGQRVYLILESDLLDFLQHLAPNLKVKEMSPTNQGSLILLCQREVEDEVLQHAQTAI